MTGETISHRSKPTTSILLSRLSIKLLSKSASLCCRLVKPSVLIRETCLFSGQWLPRESQLVKTQRTTICGELSHKRDIFILHTLLSVFRVSHGAVGEPGIGKDQSKTVFNGHVCIIVLLNGQQL